MSNSSLSYQVLLYLNSFYFGLFVFMEFVISVFKAAHLPYPSGDHTSELLLLVFLCFIESARIFLGSKGNLSEKRLPVIVSIGLTVPSVIGTVYFFVWQVYVLRIEIVLCAIQLTLEACELFFSLLCLADLYRHTTYSL